MANIKIAGASYSGVPRIDVPTTTTGTASFYECTGTKDITENGTHDVTGLASVLVSVAGGGGGLPSGISALDFGQITVSSDFTTTRQTFTHKLGTTPDFVMVWATANIATTYSMLFAFRSTQMGYRSSTYNSYLGYHGNSTTTVSIANNNSTSYGVSNLTATSFQLASNGTSYYWRKGSYNYMAIKFS